MMKPIPLNASEIFVEWRKDECGIGITTFTDEAGLPYIGLYPLDFEGQPAGLPTYFQRSRLMADVFVGFMWCKPAVLFINVEVTGRGLDVRLTIPSSIAGQDAPRHLWAYWGGPEPKFPAFAANNNRPVNRARDDCQ
jgi:hypothetical protein